MNRPLAGGAGRAGDIIIKLEALVLVGGGEDGWMGTVGVEGDMGKGCCGGRSVGSVVVTAGEAGTPSSFGPEDAWGRLPSVLEVVSGTCSSCTIAP